MNANIIRHLSSQGREKLARLSLFIAGHVYEDHVHTRFKVLGVESKRLVKLFLSLVVILNVAQTFAHKIGVAAAERAVREREVWIKSGRALEMLNRRVNVFARDSVIDEASHAVAPAQVFVVGFRVDSRSLRHSIPLIRAQFKTKTFDDSARYDVLNRD